MVKFAYITDTHIRPTKPRQRVETNFADVVFGKFEYFLKKCEEEEVEFIIHGGDVFDSPNPSTRTIVRTMDLLRKYAIPFITTVGQHDCFGTTDVWSYKDSALGILEAQGLVTVLLGGRRFRHPYESLHIQGYGYKEKETEEFLQGTEPLPHSGFRVCVVHAPVGANEDRSWRSIEEFSPNANLTFFGDIHTDLFENVNGCFLGGPMVRQKQNEMHHQPQFYIFEVERTQQWSYKKYEIPVTPIEFAFKIEDIENGRKKAAEGFVAALSRSKGESAAESAEGKLRRIGAELGISEKAVQLAVEALPVRGDI